MAENIKPEKVKGKQVAVTFTHEQFAEFDKVSWQRKHRQNSSALREAVRVWMKLTEEDIQKILGS